MAGTVSMYHMQTPHKHGGKVSNILPRHHGVFLIGCHDNNTSFQAYTTRAHVSRASVSIYRHRLSPTVIPEHSYSGEFDPNEARPLEGAFEFRFKTCVSGRKQNDFSTCAAFTGHSTWVVLLLS